MNKRIPIDIYDDMPPGMKRYITNYGFHFNKKAYLYAVKVLKRLNRNTAKKENLEPYTREQVDALLEKYKVDIENTIMYDYVYLASVCKAYYLGSSIPDEQHLALYLKDNLSNPEMDSGIVFRKWMQEMIGNGYPIDWDEII